MYDLHLSVYAMRPHLLAFDVWRDLPGQPNRMEVASVTMQEIGEGESTPPAFMFRREEVETFVNQLWELGIRPSKAEAKDGQIEALKAHIADLQKIVFNAIRSEADQTVVDEVRRRMTALEKQTYTTLMEHDRKLDRAMPEDQHTGVGAVNHEAFLRP